MELSLMVNKAGIAQPYAFPTRALGIQNSSLTCSAASRVVLLNSLSPKAAWRKLSVRARAIRSEVVVKENALPALKHKAEPVPLFVGLPLDVVSDANTVNHGKAIVAGLRALSLLGVHGVDLPISWGVASDSHDWSSYVAVATMVRDAGLRIRISLNLHADPSLPLPKSVVRAVAADPDLLFSDRSGRRRSDCLSFAVDDLPVLDGKTPMEVYEEFFQSFRLAFADFIGSTITDVTVSLGPNGELRYPSSPDTANNSFTGVGEFQCYDKYMLADLKRHAEEAGNPLWGRSGPHDAPEYNSLLNSGSFFKECGGTWETPYGQFFLSWYSGKLLSHCNRLLSVAHKVLGGLPLELSAKVPLLHSWHNSRSRPAQLTAGFYNVDGRDGYEAVAEIFARNSCTMIIPGMELSDRNQPCGVAQSCPEGLLSQIMRACDKHGVSISGENSSLVGDFSAIKDKIFGDKSGLESFTYQRMGAEFFSPDHWLLFNEFINSMAQPTMDANDMPCGEKTFSHSLNLADRKNREMLAL